MLRIQAKGIPCNSGTGPPL